MHEECMIDYFAAIDHCADTVILFTDSMLTGDPTS